MVVTSFRGVFSEKIEGFGGGIWAGGFEEKKIDCW